ADRADALAVKPEILRATRDDDDLGTPFAHQTHAVGVLGEPLCEALVREIDERHDPAALADLRKRMPFVALQVGAARVVTAAVQQQEIARWNLLHGVDHSLEV